MEDLILSLLLMDITKRDIKLVLTLYTLYNSYVKQDEKKGRSYKIRDIGDLTGFTSTAIVSSLEDLVRYNVLGKLLFDNKLVGRKIKSSFSEAFLSTVKDKENAVKESVNKVGYYITDDSTIYVFNPYPDNWKYPTWKKVEKTVNKLNELLDSTFIDSIIENKNTGKNTVDGTKVSGLSIPKSIAIFCKKYKATYNSNYAIVHKHDYPIIKRLLKQFELNSIPGTQFQNFIDFAFSRALQKGNVLAINHLKSYANEFMVNTIKTGTNGFYYDDSGVLKRKI